MKRLLKMIMGLVLVWNLSACSSTNTLDLTILKTVYTHIGTIEVSGGTLAESRFFNAAEILYFTGYMNGLNKLSIVEEEDVPVQDAVKCHIRTRNKNADIYVVSPYVKVGDFWLEAKDDNDLQAIEGMQAVIDKTDPLGGQQEG